MTTLIKTDSIHRSPSRLALLLIPVVFACFALSPTARALLPPPAPDGGYPNGNTAEGTEALYSLTTGVNNTAIGFKRSIIQHHRRHNTAIGRSAQQHHGAATLPPVLSARLQHHRQRQYRHRWFCALLQHHRQRKYRHRCYALTYNTTGNNNTADGSSAL